MAFCIVQIAKSQELQIVAFFPNLRRIRNRTLNEDNKFSFRFLGATMEAMNLKPENFIKIFWHIALMIGFIMLIRFFDSSGKFLYWYILII